MKQVLGRETRLRVLDDYERELGQKFNREKTSLIFSKNTNKESQEEIKKQFWCLDYTQA